MSSWDVELVFADGASNKFWRARAEDCDLHLNWGRVGTAGQSKVKSLGSAKACETERDKVADSKRKKGYADEEGAPAAPAEVAKMPEISPDGPRAAALKLDGEGRKMRLDLKTDGATVVTEVVETYKSEEEARAAFDRIESALRQEGYRN